MNRSMKRAICMLLATVFLMPCFCFGTYAQGKTGVGMAQWALRAYNEGWKYVFGGEEVGAVDCSGLIRSYTGCWDNASQLLQHATESGSASDIPNIHGLGLWCEGHCGVYVGKNSEGTNMAVDARNSRVNVVYSTMDSRSWNPWVKWFKIAGVEYPDTGWVEFNGSKYYYHNGEYVTGYFEVNGKLYDFGKSGALRGEVDKSSTTTTKTTTTTAATKTTAKTTTTKGTTATTTTAKTNKTTTTTTAASSKLLKLGMSGDKVKELQTRLKELGYLKANITGYYGEQTVMAVRMFQKQVGLSPDGVAGEKTQELLFAANAPTRSSATSTTTTTTTTAAKTTTTKTGAASTTTTTTKSTVSTTTTTSVEQYYASLYSELEFGMSGKAVESLINRLIELGYYDHEPGNYYGVFARLAVMSFQINAGLNASGVADPETQYLLYLDSAPKAEEEPTADILYDSEDLNYDEGELVEENVSELVIVESNGLGGYSTSSDMVYFVNKYSSSDKLQTFGVLGFDEPTVTIYKAGESFELSGELSEAIDNCVLF